jgi:hypothetical protein
MARATRVDFPGSRYHVLNRGTERRAIVEALRAEVRGIPLFFPTVDGCVFAAKAQDFFLPTGELPPPVSGRTHLANLRPHEAWRPLLEWAMVNRLDLPIGTVAGTIVGALIIGVLNNTLDLMNVSAFLQQIVKGCIIVGAVILDQLENRGGK